MARFGSVNLKIRPIKIAFLVEPKNSKHVREAIQISSTLWGGSYSPITKSGQSQSSPAPKPATPRPAPSQGQTVSKGNKGK